MGRKSAHRNAMLSNMAISLIMHKRITTTVAKAKALRSYIEPIITKSKEDSTHLRRIVFSELQNKVAVSELFREVAVKVADRPGGYTRILKTGSRMGDNAEMCIIELVDYNENMLGDQKAAKTKSRRRRPAAKKKAGDEAPKAEVAAPKAKEEVVEEPKAEATTEEVKDETETKE